MKLSAVLLIALSLLGSPGGRAADAELVVLAFTLSSEGPEVRRERRAGLSTSSLVRKDFLVERFSNREFLLDLRAERVIADIRGWSLVRLSDPRRGDLGFFIIRPGAVPIEVNNRLALARVTMPIESFVALRVARGNSLERTGNAVQREIATLRISSALDEMITQGVLTSASTTRNGLLATQGAEFTSGAGFSLPRRRPPLPDPLGPIPDAAIVEGFASFTRSRTLSGGR